MAADWSGDLEQVSSETGVSCIDSFLHSPNVSVDISASKEETFGNDSAAKTDDHNTNVIWIVEEDGGNTCTQYSGEDIPGGSQASLDTSDQSTEQILTPHTADTEDAESLEDSELKFGDGLRRGDREKRERRSYSPDVKKPGNRGKKRRKRARTSPNTRTSVTNRPYDKLPNGQPFSCDLCKSPFVCNPARRANQVKRSKHMPSPRYKRDQTTGKVLILCNACGLAFERPQKPPKAAPAPSPGEKEKYLEEARTFALSLAEGLNDPDAERLCCPHFKLRPCGCLQKYIIRDGQMDESRKRASELLVILKEAKRLASEKCYDVEEVFGPNGRKKNKSIGLGNGQRKSKAFEDYILKHRQHLREELKLCERATQRVLCYSNNFLHKRLKTDERGFRAERVKGKAALGQLKDISLIPQERCCVDNCSMLALTHACLLHQWRERATSGQIEARRVLAEMLTPSGGARSNCYKFISWITGCSHSTIGRVNDQMKRTGGDREPPEHGLRKYWQDHPKRKCKSSQDASQEEQESVEEVIVEGSASPQQLILQQLGHSDLITIPLSSQPLTLTQAPTTATNNSTLQLQVQRQQLLQLQKQLTQQQLQIQQQQQILQQQLLQQALLQQQSQLSPAASPTATTAATTTATTNQQITVQNVPNIQQWLNQQGQGQGQVHFSEATIVQTSPNTGQSSTQALLPSGLQTTLTQIQQSHPHLALQTQISQAAQVAPPATVVTQAQGAPLTHAETQSQVAPLAQLPAGAQAQVSSPGQLVQTQLVPEQIMSPSLSSQEQEGATCQQVFSGTHGFISVASSPPHTQQNIMSYMNLPQQSQVVVQQQPIVSSQQQNVHERAAPAVDINKLPANSSATLTSSSSSSLESGVDLSQIEGLLPSNSMVGISLSQNLASNLISQLVDFNGVAPNVNIAMLPQTSTSTGEIDTEVHLADKSSNQVLGNSNMQGCNYTIWIGPHQAVDTYIVSKEGTLGGDPSSAQVEEIGQDDTSVLTNQDEDSELLPSQNDYLTNQNENTNDSTSDATGPEVLQLLAHLQAQEKQKD